MLYKICTTANRRGLAEIYLGIGERSFDRQYVSEYLNYRKIHSNDFFANFISTYFPKNLVCYICVKYKICTTTNRRGFAEICLRIGERSFGQSYINT